MISPADPTNTAVFVFQFLFFSFCELMNFTVKIAIPKYKFKHGGFQTQEEEKEKEEEGLCLFGHRFDGSIGSCSEKRRFAIDKDIYVYLESLTACDNRNGCLEGNKYKPKKKKAVVEEAALAQPSRRAKAKASVDDADGTLSTIPWEGYKPATEINVCLCN